MGRSVRLWHRCREIANGKWGEAAGSSEGERRMAIARDGVRNIMGAGTAPLRFGSLEGFYRNSIALPGHSLDLFVQLIVRSLLVHIERLCLCTSQSNTGLSCEKFLSFHWYYGFNKLV